MRYGLTSVVCEEVLESKGFTFLGIVNGEKIFCNLNSKESISNCLDFLKKLTNEEWQVFKEKIGYENLVFYKAKMFNQCFSYLKLKDDFNGAVELPLNCSSCFRMFEGLVLKDGFSISGNTSGVIDTEFMFADTTLSEGFRLGEFFDTSNVCNMSSMFSNCKLNSDFVADFNTSKVLNMDWMFSGCKMPKNFVLSLKTDYLFTAEYMFLNSTLQDGFKFGDEFKIDKIKSLRGFFEEAIIPVDFQLSDNFVISADTDITSMFDRCTILGLKSTSNLNSVDIFKLLKDRTRRINAVRSGE